jgi:hypothetical protein
MLRNIDSGSATLSCTGLPRHSISTIDKHKVSSDISADHDRAQWGRVKRRQNPGHHKNCVKIHEGKWLSDFIGDKQVNTTALERARSSSERKASPLVVVALHINKPTTV